jgi:dihydroneopterin aldolase
MRFHALVGILPHEREVPQPIEVDLSVNADPAHGVLDYRRLYDVTASVVANDGESIDYLEEIGDRVADRVFALGRVVRAVRVAVRKPHVALGGPLAYAEVVVDRRADA